MECSVGARGSRASATLQGGLEGGSFAGSSPVSGTVNRGGLLLEGTVSNPYNQLVIVHLWNHYPPFKERVFLNLFYKTIDVGGYH